MLLRRRKAQAGNRTVPSDRLPAVNEHVRITTATGEARPSRVEDAASGVVMISRPTAADGYPLRCDRDEPVTLRWTSEWGVHEVAGTVVETVTEPVPLWTVRAEAAQPVHQRRESFRLEVRLPLTLAGTDGGECPTQAPAGTSVVDLSEGGLGFEGPAGGTLSHGDAVLATFPIDDGDITLAATIVRLGTPRDGTQADGVRFDEVTEDLATRLRRYVLQEQIRRRALVRD